MSGKPRGERFLADDVTALCRREGRGPQKAQKADTKGTRNHDFFVLLVSSFVLFVVVLFSGSFA
jgi:hypothetical protein